MFNQSCSNTRTPNILLSSTLAKLIAFISLRLCLFLFHIGCTYLLLVEVPFAKGALATEPAMAVFDADSRSHSAPTMAAALPLWLPDGAAEDALQEGDSIDKRKLSHYSEHPHAQRFDECTVKTS